MKQGLSVTRSVSVWNKPLDLKFSDFFFRLGTALTDESGGIKSFLDAVSSVRSNSDFKQDPREVAWLLIYRSLLQAIAELVQENEALLLEEPKSPRATRYLLGDLPDDPDSLATMLEVVIEKSKVKIDKKFFLNPQALPLLELIKKCFLRWLTMFGLSEAKANAISDRLPVYFLSALNDQWQNRPKEYSVIKEAIDTPFTKATEEEISWNKYSAWLQKQVDEPVFAETFGLRQIFVPLRAYYHSASADRPQVVNLEHELQNWLEVTSPEDCVVVISGGPGSGKSSFAKMFAAEQAAIGQRRVLLIPLHLFDAEGDLLESLTRFINYDDLLPSNPLNSSQGKQVLLIFDGLDELAMQGKIAEALAQNFLIEVLRKSYQVNLRSSRLKILITGRELTIQATGGSLDRPRQVLHLLPYYIPKDEKQRFGDVENLLSEDQRIQWWKRYCQLTGSYFARVSDVLNNPILTDVTAQPLLNYLLALSLVRGNLDLSKETNVNNVYRDLLSAVYQRSWTSYQHPSVSGVTEDQFIRLLEEIAVSTWHGDGRTTTLKEVESHCEQSGLGDLLKSLSENPSVGVGRLLLAFYFRRAGNRVSGDQTFEFTHKSFAEYLTSRRIIRTVAALHAELARHKEYAYSGWDQRMALLNWVKLTGPVQMDLYLAGFVEREVSLQREDEIRQWQKTLEELIGFTLWHGTPLDHLSPRPSFVNEIQQRVNTEESLISILNYCAKWTNDISEIDWPSPDSLKSWLMHLQASRRPSRLLLALQCLSHLKMDNCDLSNMDLRGANFGQSSLVDADLTNSNLRGVDLNGSDLTKADLSKVNLKEANLANARLRLARLFNATLSGANLSHAILDGANLHKADLSGAFLRFATLEACNLRNANLKKATLNFAKLIRARLSESDLSNSSLTSANLAGAILVRATLAAADLDNANLERANLKEADLSNAFLRRTNLQHAYLLRTDLRTAYVQGANLKGTNPPSNYLLT